MTKIIPIEKISSHILLILGLPRKNGGMILDWKEKNKTVHK
jgi:hypothetical protein